MPSLWGRLQVYSARASHVFQTISPVSPLRGKLLSLLWGRLQVYSARASHSANKSSASNISLRKRVTQGNFLRLTTISERFVTRIIQKLSLMLRS
ncbi:hypothetical protein FC15_GL000871 [Lapidilactobacillus concavus DSM 17758]|uniref:Uncharacterized protein n=1 Tax=Lapidilactobacillus concavus DSM 17758 TaxID=1423735 RepID=A0A0R1VVB5_9LACO|nr:hypothetical protein FC15_GL000871 [Lapidilactobacillus concavus DSM 17758]